ncbi:hypothetical protein L6R52_41850 [Myxococcota bacterium]|nr:hypothetical protein [Myxococcota bacterium]
MSRAAWIAALLIVGAQTACGVERDLERERFTCEAGGVCDGEDADGGVRDDAGPRPDGGVWIDLDGLIPDINLCVPPLVC